MKLSHKKTQKEWTEWQEFLQNCALVHILSQFEFMPKPEQAKNKITTTTLTTKDS